MSTLGAIFTLFLLTSCDSDAFSKYPKGKVTLKTGEVLTVIIADTFDRQKQGLSGVQKKDWPRDQLMFFPSRAPHIRRFWMRNTFFNLDIIFLTADLYVVDISRNMPFNTDENPAEHEVAWTPPVHSQHVLEISSDSSFAQKIKVGDKLNWSSDPGLSQIVSGIHPSL